MSKLDQHVAAVQNRLALRRFITSIIWTVNLFVALVIIAILAQRVFAWHMPYAKQIFYSGLGASFVAAIVWAMVTRPSSKFAAVAIDEKLGLKEKLSTALFMRASDDPFAKAAVKDAEDTAANVARNVSGHFPLSFPRTGYATMLLMIVAFCTASFMPQLDLFGQKQQKEQQAAIDAKKKSAERVVKQALAAVEAVPKSMQNDEAVKNAKISLQNLMNQPIKDPAQASRTALQAAQDVQEALKREALQNQKYAMAQNEMKMSKNYMPAPDEKGPVADAQRDMAKGDFTEAMNKLNKMAENFDKMDKKEQEKAAQQMNNMAKQMQAQAQQQQQQQQQNQNQLQQMGATQQQAAQMQQLMQQAAQGNQQAQQQLNQMAQQMAQQMNNGQGPTQQQQQQMQQAMAQMQAQANGANNAQQMAAAAQAMAQAMQNAGQQGGNQQGGNQQMQQAMQQMQQQMGQMDAMSKDAQEVQAAQQAMQDAADQAAGQCNGDGGEGEQQANGQGKNGDWKQGDPNNKNGKGFGGPGQASGGRPKGEPAPYGVKEEISKSQDNKSGKLLAATYIKDNKPIKGEAKENLKTVADAAEHEAAEEVDTDRISRQASKAVKDYFGSLGEEQPAAQSGTTGAQTPAPAETK